MAKNVPDITEVIIQSDNAGCYSSPVFTVGLSTLFALTGIRVCLLLHCEAQDGKSHLDGNFGIMSQAIRRFVDSDHDVKTPKQLMDALLHCKPSNSMVRLLHLDADHIEKLAAEVKRTMPDLPRMKTFKQYQFSSVWWCTCRQIDTHFVTGWDHHDAVFGYWTGVVYCTGRP